jgi:hypothetical protein
MPERIYPELEAFLDGEEGERCRACYIEDHDAIGKGPLLPTVKIEWNLE